MKSFKFLTTVLCVTALSTNVAFAEMSKRKLEVPCASTQDIMKIVFSEWGEIPIIRGESSRGNGRINHSMIFTVNPSTFSWSLLEQIPNTDEVCVIATGTKLEELSLGGV